jgi:hypothetical protein
MRLRNPGFCTVGYALYKMFPLTLCRRDYQWFPSPVGGWAASANNVAQWFFFCDRPYNVHMWPFVTHWPCPWAASAHFVHKKWINFCLCWHWALFRSGHLWFPRAMRGASFYSLCHIFGFCFSDVHTDLFSSSLLWLPSHVPYVGSFYLF